MGDDEKSLKDRGPRTRREKADGAAAEASTHPVPESMKPIADAVKARFPEVVVSGRPDEWLELRVPKEQVLDLAQMLRADPACGLHFLSSISAVDYKEKGFQVVYHLLNLTKGHRVVVKVDLPDRDDPKVSSVVSVWPTANWHEREAWDLMGIRFEGHPDLRRILMREDWVGHPLRKDYVDDRPPRGRVTRESYDAGLALPADV